MAVIKRQEVIQNVKDLFKFAEKKLLEMAQRF